MSQNHHLPLRKLPQDKKTAAPAATGYGGEDFGKGLENPSTSVYRNQGGWIKPDVSPSWIKLSTALAHVLDRLPVGGAE